MTFSPTARVAGRLEEVSAGRDREGEQQQQHRQRKVLRDGQAGPAGAAGRAQLLGTPLRHQLCTEATMWWLHGKRDPRLSVHPRSRYFGRLCSWYGCVLLSAGLDLPAGASARRTPCTPAHVSAHHALITAPPGARVLAPDQPRGLRALNCRQSVAVRRIVSSGFL